MNKCLISKPMINQRAQKGATLIEVLVSVLVMSVGMLGMVSLQARAMQFNQSSFYQSQASVMAYDIMDLMRANSGSNSVLSQYMHGMTDSIPSSYSSCYGTSANCTTTQLAKYDLYSWLEELAIILPSGLAEIAVDNSGATPVYLVTIQYDDSRTESSSAYGQSHTSTPKQLTFRTEL